MLFLPVTASEAVARARTLLHQHVIYHDGAGGVNPVKATDAAGRLDCSGMIAFALDIPRDMGSKFGSYEWIETTRIFKDAKSTRILFNYVQNAKPGDVIVYGDTGSKDGHVGLITEAKDGLPARVIHTCARAGLSSATIEEPYSVFWEGAVKTRGAIFARPAYKVVPVVPPPSEHAVPMPTSELAISYQGRTLKGMFDRAGGTSYVAAHDVFPTDHFNLKLSPDGKTLTVTAK